MRFHRYLSLLICSALASAPALGDEATRTDSASRQLSFPSPIWVVETVRVSDGGSMTVAFRDATNGLHSIFLDDAFKSKNRGVLYLDGNPLATQSAKEIALLQVLLDWLDRAYGKDMRQMAETNDHKTAWTLQSQLTGSQPGCGVEAKALTDIVARVQKKWQKTRRDEGSDLVL